MAEINKKGALFKLFRATGNLYFLELIRETAHNLPQYLSREDRPIYSWDGDIQLPGWMNESVNMSDWEGKDKIGGVFHCYCWSEVSNMLTWAEIPGIYLHTDTGFISVFDHVEADVIENSGDTIKVRIHNPTKFDSVVKVFTENSADMKKPLNQIWLYGCKRVSVKSGETVVVEF
jgi:hypothetical protein